MKDFVSVIICCFNEELHIGEAINSILNQTYQNFEIIIVDDNSNDKTIDIISQFLKVDNRIKLISHEKNEGSASSRNIGIKNSKYELIAILDADDICLPNRLEIQVKFLNQNPEIGIVGSSAFYRGSNKLDKIINMSSENDRIQSEKYLKCPFINSTTVFRKCFFLNVGGYNPYYKRAQDYDLWLRMLKITKGHNINIPLIIYNTSKSHKLVDLLWYPAHASYSSVLRDSAQKKKLVATFRHIVANLWNFLK
ncbi:glycosyltransferase family 2 protein [Lacihabitans soyangensis]|uniref:Glycosyltransferase family 2 protein n=1 Tax=Lacihabitans soyangensis TaxID=869394 RepID=A0AAE3H256_9BACT|nr:glycosyltransferase family A protein [Lacihabitans soyangensis]MCP9762905.1 glycosyltransferase family 2 protein [Lacihabitans soyangensis]